MIDSLQLGEIEGIHHGTHRENMWWWNALGYTPAGVEAWNCIRALDYCPPVDINFGDYLRALITADSDLVAEDRYGYRVALLEAFAAREIYPEGVRSLSVESLRWARRLIASGVAKPFEIAITAPSTAPWDDSWLALAGDADCEVVLVDERLPRPGLVLQARREAAPDAVPPLRRP